VDRVPGRESTDGRIAASKLGTLVAIDVESISATGRTTSRFTLTKAGRRLIAQRHRTRLTLLIVLRDAQGHGVLRTSTVILR